MNRKTVLLLYGGQSSEHDISILSARNVYAAMDDEKYAVVLCYIDNKGKWWKFEDWVDDPRHDHNGVQLLAAPGSASFVTTPGNDIVHIDIILPILHGKNGEDGAVQGFAQMMQIPIAGPSLLGAAINMDKDLTKHIANEANVPVLPWILWRTHEKQPSYEEVAEVLGAVFFVKPSSSGSSFGVSKVHGKEEYESACIEAAKHDVKVLIETAAIGFEVQVAVYGNSKPVVSEICEIESSEDFHDFEDKYSEDSSVQFHIPARLSEEQRTRIRNYALDAYLATECRGMARLDFFVVDENNEYLNETNTIPGFTSVSVYPKLWQHKGIKYPELIDKLIDVALE